MTVDKPTPGNLIATVSELVDAENAGGTVVKRGLYDISGTTTSGGSHALSWAETGGVHQDHILTLTDPLLPTLTVAGLVIITGSIQPLSNPINPYGFIIDMDINNDDLTCEFPCNTYPLFGGKAAISVAYFVPTGGAIKLQVSQTSGGNIGWVGQLGVVVTVVT